VTRTRVIFLAVWVFISGLFIRTVMSDEPLSYGLVGAALGVVIALSIVWVSSEVEIG
jgi:hypothetical protein